MKNLENLKLQELTIEEQVNINGGNGIHSGGYGLVRDMDQSGAFTIGVIYGTVKGLARRWFG